MRLVDGEAYLCQTDAEQNLWKVVRADRDEHGQEICVAYILVYVDDILIAAALEVLKAVSQAI